MSSVPLFPPHITGMEYLATYRYSYCTVIVRIGWEMKVSVHSAQSSVRAVPMFQPCMACLSSAHMSEYVRSVVEGSLSWASCELQLGGGSNLVALCWRLEPQYCITGGCYVALWQKESKCWLSQFVVARVGVVLP